MNLNILRFDSIGSTNTEAINQAKLGAEEGLCVIARQQTAGRGRHGRTWVSEKDAGLYFSIVLRPKIEIRFLPLITLMTGVAVYDTLRELGASPDIKWVNDILVNEKKISGILAETTETDHGMAVVVGVGINIKSTNFPPEIADIATSIETETGRSITSSQLAEILTKFIAYFYQILGGENGSVTIIDEWRKRSSYYSGKSVSVSMEHETLTGTTDGLEETGALRVRKADGAIAIIYAGDVKSLRAVNRTR